MRNRDMHANGRPLRGISLVEAIVSIGIVGVMLAASLSTVGASYMRRQGMEDRARANLLAQELMTEILVKPYNDPGGSSILGIEIDELLAPRSNFDDVDDYDGWSASPPEEVDGTEISGLDGWSRSASVVETLDSNLKSTSPVETGIKRITVTVKKDGVTLATLVAIRAAGADSQSDDDDRTLIEIDLGGLLG